jgi:hypothetical protein
MSSIINIVLFVIVLVLYLHIVQQLKTSEDLEIYEMDYTTNAHLQEVCDVKQPVLFEYNSVSPDLYSEINSEKLDACGIYEVKVKDIKDYYLETDGSSPDYVVLPLQSATNLLKSDTHSSYFTENNHDFVEDANLYQFFHANDEFIKPPTTVITKYDVMMGSSGAYTPLRFHKDCRRFISTLSGKITIKMTPYKSSKYLSPVNDYENYEFRSQVNVWAPQKKYKSDVSKLKFLEFDVMPGFMLYIPPYWWYSIKFSDGQDTLVSGFTYNTMMNCITNIPNWALYYLQQHNTKTRIAKTIAIEPTTIATDLDAVVPPPTDATVSI